MRPRRAAPHSRVRVHANGLTEATRSFMFSQTLLHIGDIMKR